MPQSGTTMNSARDNLSEQGLAYDPQKMMYPGDEKMRVKTKRSRSDRDKANNAKRGRRLAMLVVNDRASRLVTPAQFRQKKRTNKRLCGDLTMIIEHLNSVERVKQGKPCDLCGELVRMGQG